MIITITGTSSGVGLELKNILDKDHTVIGIERKELDLNNINNVLSYNLSYCDILINCAGHDLGGKVAFLDHNDHHIVDILNANLISPVLLSHKALNQNSNCKIVNITSTNILRYWGNDLAYTLSKEALSRFGNLLKVDYPNVKKLEVILGLTKTNFNVNRHKSNHKAIDNLYENSHLTAHDTAKKIVDVLFNDQIKQIEISS